MDKIILDMDYIRKNEAAKLFAKLNSQQSGLSSSAAENRLKIYGPNEIKEKKINPIVKFLSYFWGPIPWMIELACVLSAIIRHWEDFWVILVMLLLNAVVGFWQEHKADNAIEMLKKKLALHTKVLRDGKWREAAASELVPGDIIRIRLGDIVPADLKLVDGSYLSVDESTLTGESLPVDKKSGDVCYSGSIVRQGEMNGLVVATAMNTFFGRTAKLVAEARTKSHFQKAVIKIGNYLIALAIVLVVVIFIVAMFRHESALSILQFILVLVIAAIPVALPAVLTVTMAVGAIALARKKAIVSKLASIEEMAGMDVLCSDKTGTITKNQLTLDTVETFSDLAEANILFWASLASREEDQDPIDDVIIKKVKTLEINKTAAEYKIKEFKPFNPVIKRTEATLVDSHGLEFKVSKGAPQVILDLVENKDVISKKVEEAINDLARRGYRALGVAKSDSQGKWQFLGLIPFFDPPREDSAQTIKTAEGMGVQVKMVTGDHAAIAKEIAKKVNLGTNIESADRFLKKPDDEAEKIVENVDGFAQVFPEHKYRIVELLQGKGHIVGMTGDGVNDAPALKKANIGIAVNGATDAAKSAAAIVLTSPGLSVIINAIQESRKIFQRMNNYALYRIAETIRVLIFMTLSIVVFNFYPVTAIMIVLLALLNDLPIMTISLDNVEYSNKPERWDMRRVLNMATILGIVGVIASFGVFFIGNKYLHLNRDMLQSLIYLKLSVAGHLTLFVARTKKHFWSIKPAKPLFLAVIATQTVATLIVVYGFILPAIGWGLALFVWAYALVAFIITDFIKVWAYKIMDKRATRV